MSYGYKILRKNTYDKLKAILEVEAECPSCMKRDKVKHVQNKLDNGNYQNEYVCEECGTAWVGNVYNDAGDSVEESKLSFTKILAIALVSAMACFVLAIAPMAISSIGDSQPESTTDGFNCLYDDYSDKMVSGTQVKSAVNLFEGDLLGIVVSLNDGTKKQSEYFGAQLKNIEKDTDGEYQGEIVTDGNNKVSYNSNDELSKIPSSLAYKSKLIRDEYGTVIGIIFESNKGE